MPSHLERVLGSGSGSGVLGLLLGVLGLALVPDVGHEAGVPVDGVGDDLGPAVGEGDRVLAGRLLAVPALVGVIVDPGVVVLDLVGVLVAGRLGGLVGGGGGSVAAGRAVGEDGGGREAEEGEDGGEGLEVRAYGVWFGVEFIKNCSRIVIFVKLIK